MSGVLNGKPLNNERFNAFFSMSASFGTGSKTRNEHIDEGGTF